MSKGKAKSTLLGIQGVVGHKNAPDWSFLYEHSTIRDPKWNIGDRVVLPDGRVFRYAKCGPYAITHTELGVCNETVLVAGKTAGTGVNAVTVPSVAVGAKEVTVTFTAGTLGDSASTSAGERTGVVAEDELRGGYINFYTGTYPSTMQQRGIIGNTAVAVADESMTIYLDAALSSVLTSGSSYCEILANPYGNVSHDNDNWVTIVGMPNVLASVGDYFWIQTWGPLRIIPSTGGTGETANEREFCFDTQGAVVPAVTDYATIRYQHAGYLIERTNSNANSAAPFINLQINP